MGKIRILGEDAEWRTPSKKTTPTRVTQPGGGGPAHEEENEINFFYFNY